MYICVIMIDCVSIYLCKIKKNIITVQNSLKFINPMIITKLDQNPTSLRPIPERFRKCIQHLIVRRKLGRSCKLC